MLACKESDLEKIRSELYYLIQTNDDNRVLDSLETIVVRTCLDAQGLHISDDQGPLVNTIGEWLLWLRQFLKDG